MNFKKLRLGLSCLLTIAILVTFISFNVVSAAGYTCASGEGLTCDQIGDFQSGILYYNATDESGGGCGDTATSLTSTTPVSTNQDQTQNAETVIGIDKTDNLGEQGALIGLMTAIDESSLTNDANENVPLSEQNPNKQGDGSSGTSLGIFQQQITDNWSTISSNINDTNAINQLMTPAYAAEAFYGSPPGSNVPSALSKGLQNVSGWQSLAPKVAAQRVQNPGNPPTPGEVTYQNEVGATKVVNEAQSLLSQYWNTAPAVALPVSITGGSASTTSSGLSDNCAAVSCPTTSSTSDATTTGTTDTSTPSATASSSSIGQTVVCLAQQELALWTPSSTGQPAQLQPGTNAYFKYSQGRPEEWCADFASWLYLKAGYPIVTTGGGITSAVQQIQQIGQDNQNFTWHSVDSGYTPQPGDLAIHGSQHVNIVVSDVGSKITMIGGDQGNGHFPDNIVSEYSITNPADDPVPITGYVSPN